jgi:hypothetical protein
MDCEKVRDRFSSLLEGDLKPPEEEKVREHLASCDSCRKNWEQFNRTIDWLHSVEEEEAPEGFLSEIEKKREEREGKKRWAEVRFFRTMKIPMQAAAMVMILFAVLYLTKMTPFDTLQKREVGKSETPYSEAEKKAPILKEEEKQTVVPPPSSLYRKDYASEAKPSVSDVRGSGKEISAQKMEEQDVKLPAPSLNKERTVEQPSRLKEMAKAESPPQGEMRREARESLRVMRPPAEKRTHEITLKIRDRERAISRLQDLAKQLGGEMVREDENLFLASVPASVYAEFEKGLADIGSPPAAPQTAAPNEMKDNLSVAAGAKSKDPMLIRIRLVLE